MTYVVSVSFHVCTSVKLKEMRELNSSLMRSRRVDRESLLRKLEQKVRALGDYS